MFTWTLTDQDQSQTQVLTRDPKGWEDIVLKHERGEKWHGIMYSAASELGFFCKGAGKELVDAAYEDKGQEANMLLVLDVTRNGTLTRIFTGKLDFSTYRQEWQSGVLYSFLLVENSDISKILNVREDLEVDLFRTTSLDGVPLNNYTYAGYTIQMHSRVIRLESSWENTGSLTACRPIATNALFEFHAAEWMKVKGELKSANDITPIFDVGSNSVPSINPIMEFDDSYVYPFDVILYYNLAGTYYDKAFDSNITCGAGAAAPLSRGTLSTGVFLQLKVGQTFSTATEWKLVEIPQYNTLSDVYADNFSRTGSITITVNRGDKIWLMWIFGYQLSAAPGDIQFEWAYTVADISIIADTTTPASQCTGIAIHEAWSKLSSIITDSPLAFYSEYFGRTDSNIIYPSDGCGSKTAITSGLNIRGFADSPIVTSLKKLFEATNCIWAVGLGIETYQGFEVVRVEPVYHFYQDTVVLTLTNVPGIKMTHIPERIYNEIDLGFTKWQIEGTGGLDEPNSRINYVVPDIKSSKNKLDLTCPYVGGSYAIEATRRKNHLDFTTEDTGYDEDIFFICLNKDDLTVPEKDENFQSITGLLSPETSYNLRLMMSSTFDRVKYLFTSGLTKLGTFADPVIMPAEGEGNEDVVYSFVPDGCDGDHFGSQQSNGRAGRYPHAFARRENPLWLPEEYEFSYPLPFSDYLTLIQNPYGLIRFSDGQDNFYSGWLLNLEYNLRQGSAAFRILRKFG